MKKLLRATILGLLLSANLLAQEKQYKFKGYDAYHMRESILEFTISDDGTVKGTQKISKLCISDAHLAGGDIKFIGFLTGSYPQVTGTFKGIAKQCGGKETPENGTFKMGYHPQFGVFVQLFNAWGTGVEYYHKDPHKNPFK